MKSYSQALKILKQAKIKIYDEYIKTPNSLNRVSSVNIYSKIDYPSANNASFDGYAINSSETKGLNKKNTKLFKIIGTIAAGSKPIKKMNKKFRSIEIMTGGLLSKPFNTIIPIEQISFYPNKRKPKFILINKKISRLNHVRLKGSDYRKNDLIIKKGTIIQSNHILTLKALGIDKIKVKKKPNILFFSTGKEITNKKDIKNWQVRNSNNHYIHSLNQNFLFNFKDAGILKDNHSDIFKSKIKKIFKSKIDMIITSGAVSAGKYDFIPNVIKDFKLSNYFKSISIRPGKPILFAKLKNKSKVIFGLPGNPISSAACFRFFVYPYLTNILGINDEKPVKGYLKNQFYKKKFFTRFVKSKFSTTKNGKIEIEILKGQESFKMKPFVNSNIWALLPAGKSKFKKGDIVDCFFLNYTNNNFI
tara:strand:- start:607 stop:1860 length:1254 start_codon:yes stop_codon:yes gene_type:complete